MGLFYSDAGNAARKTKKPNKPKKQQDLFDWKTLGCAQCPLDEERLIHPKIAPTGPIAPIFYFLGEAPGLQEDEQGKQFVGPSGEFLRNRIPAKWENRIRWNNTLRCRPPNNRTPEPIETECCRRLQIEDIERSKPKVLVGFGGVALEWVLGSDRQIGNWRGRRVPVKIGSHVCWFYPINHPAAILYSLEKDIKYGEAIQRAFERDISRMFSDYEAGLPPVEIEDPNTYKDGLICFEEYGSEGLKRIEKELELIRDEEHSIDIETSCLRPYSPDSLLLSIAVGTYDRVFVFPWEHPEVRWEPREKKKIAAIVGDYVLGKGRKWAHQAVFESEWLTYRYGPKVLYETEWGDTLGQAHVIDSRKGKGLDDLTQIHFGFRLKEQSNVDRENLAAVPISHVLPYNGMDTKYCFALAQIQTEILREQNLTHVYELMHSALPSIVMMQNKGVIPNSKVASELDKQIEAEQERVTESIMKDKDVVRFCETGYEFSPSSNQKLVALFKSFLRIPHPKGEDRYGKYSVDEDALSKIRHPVAKKVLELRGMSKNRGTYIVPLLEGGKNIHGDGLVHASFNAYITVSGRLSCNDPNLQNFPSRKHKEVRKVIGCPSGHKFVSFDYGQLEARIIGSASRDPILCKEIDNNQDIHGDWTDRIGGVFFPDQVKKDRKAVRSAMKTFWTFANFYGNPIEALAYDLSMEFKVHISKSDLQPFYDDFWDRYKGVLKWQEGIVSGYNKNGYVSTTTGQRRYEPMSRNEIINHPIQGTAGHLVIDAQKRISRVAYEEDRPALQPIMNIHDDLSFYLPLESLEQDIEDIARYMCTGTFDFISVPLSVEVSIGDNWGEKEEIAKFTTKDFT